jgi:hypothetical protein
MLGEYGESPRALSTLSNSLEGIGEAGLGEGDLPAALTAYTKALDVAWRVADTYGESRHSLDDLGRCLIGVANVQRHLGRDLRRTKRTKSSIRSRSGSAGCRLARQKVAEHTDESMPGRAGQPGGILRGSGA